MTTCWGILGTELCGCLYRFCEGRNQIVQKTKLTRGGAFEGGREFVEAYVGQVIVAGVLQGNRLPTTVGVPIVQSRKGTYVR